MGYVQVCVEDTNTKVNSLWGMCLMTLMNTFKLIHGRGWNPSSLLFNAFYSKDRPPLLILCIISSNIKGFQPFKKYFISKLMNHITFQNYLNLFFLSYHSFTCFFSSSNPSFSLLFLSHFHHNSFYVFFFFFF